MIDIACETCFRLSDVPRHLPPGRAGKRLHCSTVFRWAQRGLRGIKLESIRIGGALHTSEQALQRFSERLTMLDQHRNGDPGLYRSVDRRVMEAEAELDCAGL